MPEIRDAHPRQQGCPSPWGGMEGLGKGMKRSENRDVGRVALLVLFQKPPDDHLEPDAREVHRVFGVFTGALAADDAPRAE